MCQESKRYGRAVPANTVHHIFPRDEYPEYELEPWNLISLSTKAHDEMHDRNTGRLTEKGRRLLDRTAREQGIPREKFHEYVDMIAAGIILREYMENHRSELEELAARRSSDGMNI